MSKDFVVDRERTWYRPSWNASSSVFQWVLEFIAGQVDNAELAADLRKHSGSGLFALTFYPAPRAEEIVRVILGPLRDALAEEPPHVRDRVLELVELAEGWAEATDVFPLFLPQVFQRQPAGDPTTMHYRAEREPGDYLDVTFTGVRSSTLGPELTDLTIDVTGDGYAVSAMRTDHGTVRADGLRVVDERLDRMLEHTMA